jgi:serine/threonine-protein kinase
VALAAGTRLGTYEVIAQIGAGGMGEVYRARDTKLNRDVALKVLPGAFAADPDRLARFKREAQVLASLNHPHIAAIYGFEDSGSTHALVLELVEGPTLADRIAKGAIPLDEALPIAKQIAEALEAAHEQGIIHRDLKPANIKVRDDGTAKVLDFGLAKAMEPASAISPVLTNSPTITTPAMVTGIGTLLGTAAYMSPEQAKGRPADKRSDVWAFGCVLYEMVTGKRAFEGDDVSDTLAAVLRADPDWTALPATLPTHIAALLRDCLQKDRRARISDISTAQFVMQNRLLTNVSTQSVSRTRRATTIAAVALASIVVTSLAGWLLLRMNAIVPQPMRFAIVPPPAQPLFVNAFTRAVAISPNGRYIAYVEGVMGDRRLAVRSIDQLEAVSLGSIDDTTLATTPFFDPDSQWIGYVEAGYLKKVSVTGGPSITICKANQPRGASWGPDNTIYFATTDPTTGLFSVSAAGGEPKLLTTPDTSHGELDHWFPSVLPGGQAILFTITSNKAEESQIAVLDLKTGTKKKLIRGGQAEYVDSGHIVYAASATLRAVRFDVSRLAVLSDPVPVVEQAMQLPTAAANFAVSRGGTLIYVPGGGSVSALRSLVWVDRQGREQPINVAARAYYVPRISPDGTRVALEIRDQDNDIWVFDFVRQTLERRTFDPGIDGLPVWMPDGRSFIFSSRRGGGGGTNLYRQAADGTGTAERLTRSADSQFSLSISPDGRSLIFGVAPAKTLWDIQVLDLKTGGNPEQAHIRTLIQTPFSEQNADVSPDGRWVAYQSNESGSFQIYVRPFPNVDTGHWQVSADGGTVPVWSRNGRELFYIDGRNTMTAVPVHATGATFSQGNATKLFNVRYFTAIGNRSWDVTPDGQRFLMINDTVAPDRQANATPASMIVVLNWFEELKQRVPSK